MVETVRWSTKARQVVAAALMVIASLAFVGAPTSAQEPGKTYEEVINDPALGPSHSIVIRLYAAVLGRQPEVAGVVFWLDAFDSGEWTLDSIANFFVTSDEFRGVYGDLNNQDFAEAIYRNVLNRAPDQAGLAFWTGELDQGMTRARMVLLISNAPEFIAANPLPSDAPAVTNQAEANLQFDYGEIVRFETIDGVDWIWFDRWSFGQEEGVELQSEPRYEMASDWHGGRNVTTELRSYPVAPDARVLELDPGDYVAACSDFNLSYDFIDSSLGSLVALDGFTSLTFDDNQNVSVVRDQRGC